MDLYDRLVRILGPLIRFFFPVRFLNLPETLPEEGLIVCPNHISFFDPVFIAISLPRHLTFMGKEELVHRPVIGKWVVECGMIPLSRDGGDAAKLRQAVRALKEGKVLAIFPQGTRCSYPLKKEDFKPGVGMIAALSGAKILPVGIYSKNYKVRPFRKTFVHFGSVMEMEIPKDLGKKEQGILITEKITAEIEKEEALARAAGQKK